MATPSLLYSIITMTSEDLITIIYISTYTCTHVHVCTFHFFVHFFICIFYHINAFTHQVTKSGSVYKAYQIHYIGINPICLCCKYALSLSWIRHRWLPLKICEPCTGLFSTPSPTKPPPPPPLPHSPKKYTMTVFTETWHHEIIKTFIDCDICCLYKYLNFEHTL